ncbi:hypothetical protein D3C73_1507580 [compost metagenome]
MPQHVIPIRVRGESCHHRLAQPLKVLRDARHLVDRDAGVDQQHSVPALYHRAVALDELALVNQNAFSDLLQHGCDSR